MKNPEAGNVPWGGSGIRDKNHNTHRLAMGRNMFTESSNMGATNNSNDWPIAGKRRSSIVVCSSRAEILKIGKKKSPPGK